MKQIAILALLTIQFGCLGYFAGSKETYRIKQPILSKERGSLEYASQGYKTNDDPSKSYKKAEVRRLWGRPDLKKSISPDTEVWIYDDKITIWSGALLIAVLIPIPLVIPTGQEATELYFKQGRLESAVRYRNSEGSYLLCSCIPFPFQDRAKSGFQYPCMYPE